MKIEYKKDALVTDGADVDDLDDVLDVIDGQICGFHAEGRTLIFDIKTRDDKDTKLKVCV
jgi:hypothetical protein